MLLSLPSDNMYHVCMFVPPTSTIPLLVLEGTGDLIIKDQKPCVYTAKKLISLAFMSFFYLNLLFKESRRWVIIHLKR